MSLTDKKHKALVTGGTRGIGAAVVKELRDAGYEVIYTGAGRSVNPKHDDAYRACDFSDMNAVEKFAESVSDEGFSVLVNNAGINKVGALEQYSTNDFQNIQQVNVTAPFTLCRALVPGMRKRHYGRIINITSIYGVVSRRGRAAYSTSKFGLFGLSRALALEVARDNILVNCVAPGIVDTDLTRRVLGEQGLKDIVTQVPMGRLAAPDEIARFIAFLAGSGNTYMTGQNIVVDGGYTCA